MLPAGTFMMGSPESEEDRKEWEGPVHQVTVRQPFAIGKYEVTRGQYAAFVNATGRKSDGCFFWDGEWKKDAARNWRSPGFPQTDKDPVVCVSQEDAKGYTEWLSRKTGLVYRLPGEAEWEYAARANTRSARPWAGGADNACGYANVHDRTSKRDSAFDWPSHDCDDGYALTAPVGSIGANAFGLHDMLGNVSEWLADCWNDSYANAPSDSNVWQVGDCQRRVLRGGSWSFGATAVRSASRVKSNSGEPSTYSGFRIAKVLP
ncbi:MAG: formylglycine-generating enzyme family protein [Nitrospinaceae bacterium]|nr:formylglycine-generating enzyme family protein [Nitrospinaceae bacterium]